MAFRNPQANRQSYNLAGHSRTATSELTIELLGSGAAERVPFPACICPSCTEARRDRRLRRKHAKALVTAGDTRVLIDCGSDATPEELPHLDGVLLTHFHFDHVLGLHRVGWAPDYPHQVALVHPPANALWGTRALVPVLNGADRLVPRQATALEPIQIGAIKITPLALSHGTPCLGYLLSANGSRVVYLTDTRGLPPATAEFLMEPGIDLAVIDCTFAPGNGRRDHHNDLDLAIRSLDMLAPTAGVLTHISHRNWPYSAMAAYATAANDRWVVGLDGLIATCSDRAVDLTHPVEGRLRWHGHLAAAV